MALHWVLLIAGALLDLLGTIWALQGLNVLPGSFMTGDPFWAGAGAVAIVIGMLLIILAMRRKAEQG